MSQQLGVITEVTSATKVKVKVGSSTVGTTASKSGLYISPAVGDRVVVDILLNGDRVVAYPIA